MPAAVGIDVAKAILRWAAIKVTETGELLVGHPVDNAPAMGEVGTAEAGECPAVAGTDILGGIATLLQAMLLKDGMRVVRVSGLAVSSVRRSTTAGETKSAPEDPAMIADQLRMRDDLRVVTAMREEGVGLRPLTGCAEMIADQTRQADRIRDFLVSIHPGLERVVDVIAETGLHPSTRCATTGEIRAVGRVRLLACRRRAGHVKSAAIEGLADAVLRAVCVQHITMPGGATAADLIRGPAAEALVGREQLITNDGRSEAILTWHLDANLTTEFLAIVGGIARFRDNDRSAATAGLAPLLRHVDKVRYRQHATAVDMAHKCVFYQSSFAAVSCFPANKTYCQRKRTEGKTCHTAVLTLARRRVNVPHAILHNCTLYQAGHISAVA